MTSGRLPHEPSDDELPSFTGDLPSDAVLTVGLLRWRMLWALSKGKFAFTLAGALCVAWLIALVLTAPAVAPADHEQDPLPTMTVLGVLAVATAVPSLLPKVPSAVRTLLGAAPAACLLGAAAVGGTSYELGRWPMLLGLLALILGGSYVVAAGLRLCEYGRRSLARIRPPAPGA